MSWVCFDTQLKINLFLDLEKIRRNKMAQSCTQCKDLLRHLHAKNNEIGLLKESLAECSEIRDRKRRETIERAKMAAMEAEMSPLSPSSTDHRRMAVIIARNAELSAERDALQLQVKALEAKVAELGRPTQHQRRREGSVESKGVQAIPASIATATSFHRSSTPEGVRTRRSASGTPRVDYVGDVDGESSRVPSHQASQHATPRRGQQAAGQRSASERSPRSAGTPDSLARRLHGGAVHVVAVAGVGCRSGSKSPAPNATAAVSAARGWLTPNFNLLSEERDDSGKRSTHVARMTQQLTGATRVTSLSASASRRSRDVADALHWKALRICNGFRHASVSPGDLHPRPEPEPTIADPPVFASSRSPSVATQSAEEIAAADATIATLRAEVARADREMYLVLHSMEFHHDAARPFKMAYEEVKQIVAYHGVAPELRNSLNRSNQAVVDGRRWPVEAQQLGEIPACLAGSLAKALKHTVASYDYVCSSRRPLAPEHSATVREFRLNADILLSLARQPAVKAKLAM